MTAAGAGISAAGPLWNAFMRASFEGTPVESFVRPDPVITDKIMLNGSYTSPEYPDAHSILFYVNKNDPLGPIPSNPGGDIQFSNWEWAVQNRVH
jgi:membrane carboxypeptidase/penicillin-binding protein